MWFIGVEVEQETSAPPPKKNPGSAPVSMPELTEKRSLHSPAPIGTLSLNSTNISADIFALTRLGGLSLLFNP